MMQGDDKEIMMKVFLGWAVFAYQLRRQAGQVSVIQATEDSLIKGLLASLPEDERRAWERHFPEVTGGLVVVK